MNDSTAWKVIAAALALTGAYLIYSGRQITILPITVPSNVAPEVPKAKDEPYKPKPNPCPGPHCPRPRVQLPEESLKK